MFYRKIFKKEITDNKIRESQYSVAKKFLPKKIANLNNDVKENLFFMDNYLKAIGYDSTTEFFAERTAFWLNICVFLFFTIIVLFFRMTLGENIYFYISLLFCIIIAYKLAKHYFIKQYDTVIKTFIMIREAENRNAKDLNHKKSLSKRNNK